MRAADYRLCGSVTCLVALLAAVPVPTRADASTDFLPEPPPGKEWKLVWQDEFNGAKLDESKWNRLGDWKRRDGFWIKEDAFLNGRGQLVLRTRKDGDRFTSGAINTQGKFEHTFGYYVARCKLPTQPGHWPAFWLMAQSVNQVGDDGRDGTEIDVVEIPWRDGRLTANLHWDGYGKDHKSAGTNFTFNAVTNGFHTFSLLWQPTEYVIYVDGQEIWRTAAGGVSRVPEYLKLTEEIGKWAGEIRNAQLPDEFIVDYVRVYDLVDQASSAAPATQERKR
jgi:beta-glucanase (GH16 family)